MTARATEVVGAVLAGGRSQRLGRDKVHVVLAGRSLLSRSIGLLAFSGITEVVVVGRAPADLRPLDGIGPAGSVTVRAIADDHPGQGPLGGIATMLGALAATPQHDATAVLAIAVDLPLLTAEVLGTLLAAHRDAAPGVDVVVAATDRREPLCAIWNPSAAPVVRGRFDAGERAVHRVLDSLTVVEVHVDPSRFTDVDTPEQLATLARHADVVAGEPGADRPLR